MARLATFAHIAALLLVLGWSPRAYAQGFEAGGLRLTPVLRLETGYDTNVFYNASESNPQGAVRLDIAPSLGVMTLRPRAIDLQARLLFRWEQFLTGETDATRDVSGLETNSTLSARFNPNGIVSVRPAVDFRRQNNPNSNASGDAYRNIYNESSVEIGVHPGGAVRTSRMGISGFLRGIHRLWLFPERSDINRQGIGGDLDLYWNFLPKTAIFLNASIMRISYSEEALISTVTRPDGTNASFATPNIGSTPFRTTAGIKGLLSRRISVTLGAGYARANYDGGPSINPFLANAQLSYFVTPDSAARLGYARDFSDSNLGNYLIFDRVTAGLGGRYGDVAVNVDAYLQFSQYARVEDPLVAGVPLFGTEERRDTLVGAYLDATYSLTRWLALGANYRLELRSSNYGALSFLTSGSAEQQVSASFLRHAVNFVVQFQY